MTTIDTHAESALAVAAAPTGTGQALVGVASWITTTDHKRIGRMFLGFSLLMFLGLAGLGAVLAFERIDTGSIELDAGSLGQLFSLFRVGFVFFALIPLLLGAGIAVVPLQLGAKSLAFPRIAALGLWTWLTGCGLVIASYAKNGGPGGGDANAVDLFIAGLGLTIIGLLVAAASLAASVLTRRAPGMRLDRVPMFSWSALVGTVGLLLTLPVLLANLIYIFVDHRFGIRTGLEQTGWGGNAAITGWIRFALSQPQTFVYAIPVLGLVAEVTPVFARHRMMLRGVVLFGMGVFATAALAGITQSENAIGTWSSLGGFDTIQDLAPYALFNLLPILGILAVMGVCTLTLLSALRHRRLAFGAPLLFGLGAVGILTLGVVAHSLTPVTDLRLADTVYEEGVFTLVASSIVLAAMGAITYWGPKWRGRLLPKVPTVLMALAATGAAVLASVPYLIAGFNDQPGSLTAASAGELVTFDNEAAPEIMNGVVAVGYGLLLLTVLAFGLLALRGFAAGPAAGDDPWDGRTLEWMTSSPAPAGNFVDVPIVSSAEPLADLKQSGSDA